MSAGLDAELSRALEAIEAGFHVRAIATFDPNLAWAPADAKAGAWLADHHPEFDQFPVKDGETVVGVLLRNGNHAEKNITEAMEPLRDGILVSADMPITELIPEFERSHFRLVLRGSEIDGLVTRSDLLKLPIRMLLFGLVSHLELCLRSLIRVRQPWPEWREALKSGRRAYVEKQLLALQNARFEPDPLEFTFLSDAIRILASEKDLGESFRTEMTSIQNLRNQIAHSKTFISSADDVIEFINRFDRLQYWIRNISSMLTPEP